MPLHLFGPAGMSPAYNGHPGRFVNVWARVLDGAAGPKDTRYYHYTLSLN